MTRYHCERCGSWVKDKFIFGLLHACLTDEEVDLRDAMIRYKIRSQQASINNHNNWILRNEDEYKAQERWRVDQSRKKNEE